jgi:hypothetical protein
VRFSFERQVTSSIRSLGVKQEEWVTMSKTTIYVSAPQERPDFRLVQTFLWSDEQNVDSDGNAHNPASHDWTELYMANRDDDAESFDVSPIQQEPLILAVESRSRNLAARVAYFLALQIGGQISFFSQGSYEEPVALLPLLGHDFDVKAALDRVARSRYAPATMENPYPWREEV